MIHTLAYNAEMPPEKKQTVAMSVRMEPEEREVFKECARELKQSVNSYLVLSAKEKAIKMAADAGRENPFAAKRVRRKRG